MGTVQVFSSCFPNMCQRAICFDNLILNDTSFMFGRAVIRHTNQNEIQDSLRWGRHLEIGQVHIKEIQISLKSVETAGLCIV